MLWKEILDCLESRVKTLIQKAILKKPEKGNVLLVIRVRERNK